ncbi:MAG TPA: hypothetical protein VMO20_04055 [Candidatus Acidoferrum sp.]|nr:hypothetical protein [Candidatus Acidoferrum sp.]
MNAKLMLKSVFLVVIALLLVLMGMNNLGDAALAMPPLLPKVLHQPAAIMYVGFFGLGFVSGAILLAGGKRGGKSKSG